MTPPTHSRGRQETYRSGLHTLAIVTACAVFPLISVGAGVTSKGAGMAFPDGFTANGYFWWNPPGWFDAEDTRWEHGHRLLGRAVGVLAIALAVWCWRCGGSVRALGTLNLLGIVAQGLLGAFRVNEISTSLAMVHGIVGQLCFCLACGVALVTGRSWQERRGSLALAVPATEPLHRLCLMGALSVFIQLVLGAAQRHFGSNEALLAHVFWAIVVSFFVGWILIRLMGAHSGGHLLVRLAQCSAVLMVVQLLLGGLSFLATTVGVSSWGMTQWAVPSAHVAVGALLLANMVLLVLGAYRFVRPAVDLNETGAAAPIAAP